MSSEHRLDDQSATVGVGRQLGEDARGAMERVAAVPELTIVVADSVWDVRAGTACGIGCVAVTCGGTSGAELTGCGALAVYEDPHDLRERFAGSPIATLIAL